MIKKEAKFSQEGTKRDREHNNLKQEWLYSGRREAYQVPPWLNRPFVGLLALFF